MSGVASIKSALSNNNYPLSFDLNAGNHNFDIFPIYHRYLAFSWDFGAGYVRYFHFTVLPLGFLVHLLFSQSFLNLWEPIWGDKEFQSLCFPMTELERVNRWIPLRLTVRLFVRVFHAVASKLIKKSPIRWARENFLGLAVILTIKRGSFPQVEWEWKNYYLTLRLAPF